MRFVRIPVLLVLAIGFAAGCDYGGDVGSAFDRFEGSWIRTSGARIELEFENSGNYVLIEDGAPADFGQWISDNNTLTLDSDSVGPMNYSYEFNDFWQELQLDPQPSAEGYLGASINGVVILERQ